MVWFLNLLTVVSLGLIGITNVVSANEPSPDDEQLADAFIGIVNGDHVDVSGHQQRVTSGGSGSPAGGDRDGSDSTSFSRGGTTLTPREIHALLDEVCIGDGTCGPTRGDAGLNPLIALPEPAEPEPAEDDDPAPGAPPRVVTITDVARFLPAVAGLHAEPDGWAVVGVPANFWVDVQLVTVDGSLLGQTSQVRFTPRAYRWDYGDGTTRTTSSPGASWADLGQEELTDTPTSHVYEVRQDLRASVAVVYSAEYRIGEGEWTAVAGAVTGTAPPMRVLVVRERTVLTTGG